MPLAIGLKQRLLVRIEKLQAPKRLTAFDEASTKQAVILPLLADLGWDTSDVDQVKPEHSVGGMKVDYALRVDQTSKAFLEVKRVEEDLEGHQEQLLNYAFKEGVRLAVLTNGLTWWFYLPLREGSWEQRRFYAIDFDKQESEDITTRLIEFLSYQVISSGEAYANAEKAYEYAQRNAVISKTLSEAWNRIISAADETLLELISDMTESLCGYKPDSEVLDTFLARHRDQFLLPVEVGRKIPKGKPRPRIRSESYTGRSVSDFRFLGQEYKIRSWKELLLQLSEIVITRHKDEANEVLALRGSKRPYYTRNANELRSPKKIPGTDIFVEANLSSNSIVRLCLSLIALFGYSDSDLSLTSH